jgi:hypothetical protein
MDTAGSLVEPSLDGKPVAFMGLGRDVDMQSRCVEDAAAAMTALLRSVSALAGR